MSNIQQIKFYEIPPSDIERTGFEIDIVDSEAISTGDTFKNNMRDRNIDSLWLTTGSSDTANTQITFTMPDQKFLDVFIFMACNFKSYLFEYSDGANWITAQDMTNNDSDYIEVPLSVTTNLMRITIRETIIPDDEKKIGCIFAGTLIGQLEGWPVIDSQIEFEIEQTKMLSGKSHIVSDLGAMQFSLRTRVTSSQKDHDILEKLIFSYKRGFFAQLSGGSRSQFSVKLRGFDPNFIYKVKPSRDYRPEFYKGIYSAGASFDAQFVEVI